MADIISPFKFEHLLSHTFPGFFSAITLFMLLDIWSPIDLTSLTFAKGLDGVINFAGFVLLIGSILGIILDGIHHSIIEDKLFDNLKSYAEVKELKKQCLSKCLKDYTENDEKTITRHFFFNKCSGKDINQYLIEEFYCYSEFYSNTFLSLIPFSFVAPSYLLETLEIPWECSISIALASFILACFCLNSSYVAYIRYNKSLFSAVRGYIEVKK
jgi:hypothetical protein